MKPQISVLKVKQADDTWIEKSLQELQSGDIFKAFYEDGTALTFYDTDHDVFEFVDDSIVIDGKQLISCKPYELAPEIAARFIIEK